MGAPKGNKNIVGNRNPNTEWIVWAELNGYYCIGANEWIIGEVVIIK